MERARGESERESVDVTVVLVDGRTRRLEVTFRRYEHDPAGRRVSPARGVRANAHNLPIAGPAWLSDPCVAAAYSVSPLRGLDARGRLRRRDGAPAENEIYPWGLAFDDAGFRARHRAMRITGADLPMRFGKPAQLVACAGMRIDLGRLPDPEVFEPDHRWASRPPESELAARTLSTPVRMGATRRPLAPTPMLLAALAGPMAEGSGIAYDAARLVSGLKRVMLGDDENPAAEPTLAALERVIDPEDVAIYRGLIESGYALVFWKTAQGHVPFVAADPADARQVMALFESEQGETLEIQVAIGELFGFPRSGTEAMLGLRPRIDLFGRGLPAELAPYQQFILARDDPASIPFLAEQRRRIAEVCGIVMPPASVHPLASARGRSGPAASRRGE